MGRAPDVIVLSTIVRRWYVVAFIAGFFAASVRERGWKASLRFYAIAFGLGLAAEYSSTRNGFPFTRYAYTGLTRSDEIYLSNIPLFVPASFAVMIYAGRALAARWAPTLLAGRFVVAGAIATVAVDVVVDPVAVRGGRWFLGDLFHYRHAQLFGVPLGNFGGWFLVALVVLALDSLPWGSPRDSLRATASARGPALAWSIIAFHAIVGLTIGAPMAVFASLAIFGALIWLARIVSAIPPDDIAA